MNHTKLTTVVAAVVLLLGIFIVAPTSASDHCVDVGGYTICFLGAEDLGGGESQWTYSVTSDSTEGNALSHWTLELCSAFQDSVDPGDGDTYTTFSPFDGVTGREDITYDVFVGYDPPPNTGITGIKFENARDSSGNEDLLGEGTAVETDIFQFVITSPDSDVPTIGDVRVGVKTGNGAPTTQISGPLCDPTAVTLATLSAASETSFDYSAAAFVAFIALVPATIFIRRRVS